MNDLSVAKKYFENGDFIVANWDEIVDQTSFPKDWLNLAEEYFKNNQWEEAHQIITELLLIDDALITEEEITEDQTIFNIYSSDIEKWADRVFQKGIFSPKDYELLDFVGHKFDFEEWCKALEITKSTRVFYKAFNCLKDQSSGEICCDKEIQAYELCVDALGLLVLAIEEDEYIIELIDKVSETNGYTILFQKAYQGNSFAREYILNKADWELFSAAQVDKIISEALWQDNNFAQSILEGADDALGTSRFNVRFEDIVEAAITRGSKWAAFAIIECQENFSKDQIVGFIQKLQNLAETEIERGISAQDNYASLALIDYYSNKNIWVEDNILNSAQLWLQYAFDHGVIEAQKTLTEIESWKKSVSEKPFVGTSDSEHNAAELDKKTKSFEDKSVSKAAVSHQKTTSQTGSGCMVYLLVTISLSITLYFML